MKRKGRSERRDEVRTLFSVCVYALHPEMGGGNKIMNMHKAKRYTQVTCLTCNTDVNSTRHTCSPSLLLSENKGEKSNLMGKLFFFPLWMKNQHTNDADSHAKKHNTMEAHKQAQ